MNWSAMYAVFAVCLVPMLLYVYSGLRGAMRDGLYSHAQNWAGMLALAFLCFTLSAGLCALNWGIS